MELDEKKIKDLMKKHSKETNIELANAKEERLKQRKRVKRIAGTAKANFDLWGDDDNHQPKSIKDKGTKMVPVKVGTAVAAGTAPIAFKAVSKTSLRKDIQQPAQLSKKELKRKERLKEKARTSVQIELAQPGKSYNHIDLMKNNIRMLLEKHSVLN